MAQYFGEHAQLPMDQVGGPGVKLGDVGGGVTTSASFTIELETGTGSIELENGTGAIRLET